MMSKTSYHAIIHRHQQSTFFFDIRCNFKEKVREKKRKEKNSFSAYILYTDIKWTGFFIYFRINYIITTLDGIMKQRPIQRITMLCFKLSMKQCQFNYNEMINGLLVSLQQFHTWNSKLDKLFAALNIRINWELWNIKKVDFFLCLNAWKSVCTFKI